MKNDESATQSTDQYCRPQWQKKQVLGSKKVRLPQRLLNLIFGDFCEVLVLTPGTSVRNIEIHEMRGGADDDE